MKVSLIWQRRFLRRSHTASAIAILLACVCGVGCGTGSGSTNGSGSGGGNSQPVLGSITVAASQLSIPLNGTQQFTATGSYSNGSGKDLSSLVTWISSSPSVANVSGSGLATAVAAGSTN